MYFAQFYTDSNGALHEAASIMYLDGRWAVRNQLIIARAECIKRGYSAYAIFKGESFTRSHRITPKVTIK